MDSTLQTLNDIDNYEIAQVFDCQLNEFTSLIKPNSTGFTVVSQNIRSIYSNFDDLQLNITNLNMDIDLIILTECRLNASKQIPQIANYNSHQSTYHLNKADGVVAYIKNSHKYKIREVKLTHASCLEVHISPDLTVIAIYRSPSISNADEFIQSLNTHLTNIASSKNVIVTGDININLILNQGEQSHERTNRLNYLNMLAMHGLLPGHSLPTRDKSCLDHFIIKLKPASKTATIAIIHTTITDHFMTFLKITNHTDIIKPTKLKSTFNIEKGLSLLKDCDLANLLELTNPNTLTNNFIEILQNCITLSTTTEVIPLKNRTLKPWMTVGLLRCIHNRNNMQRKLRLEPFNEVLKITYKRYRNYCNHIIKRQKRKHDRDQLTKANKNPKKTWAIINGITQRKPNRTSNLDLLELSNTPQNSVNKVNSFFANIGKVLADNIAPPPSSTNNSDFNSALSNYTSASSFVLLDTDPSEVHATVMGLKLESAPGWDNISVKFLKAAHEQIVPILSYLSNLCFEQGIFPDALKVAVITPVYKGGDRSDPSNYRPISVLPSISKILEKLLNSRLIKYLSKHNILSPSQFGFRQGKSTEDAILSLTSTIVDRVDKGSKCLAVFLDLKKAFDTVSVPVLLQRLEHIGIRGSPLEIFKSYLNKRKHTVKIGEFTSTEETISYGVGQGTVLGPTMFLIYINNLCNMNIVGGSIFSYADDTAIVFADKSWAKVKTSAETGLSRIADWLNRNLLTLNATKSNYICFTKYANTQPPPQFQIKIHLCANSPLPDCSCAIIDQLQSTKYLGIMIDQRLSWHMHTELIMKRVRQLIWTFKTLRHVASKNLLHRVYVSLAQSILTYCLSCWGGTTKIKFLELERAQRSLLKVMLFKPYRFPTQSLYLTADVLSVRKLYLLHLILRKHKSLPYDPNKSNTSSRRSYLVAPTIPVRSVFAKRQYARQSSHLYNLLNRELNIYPLKLRDCKLTVTDWLKTKTYDDIETLVSVLP